MTHHNQLQNRLDMVRSVFNIKKLQSIEPDKRYIQKYYRASKIGYSLFYSSSAADRMYMGVSRDGVFKQDDLLEAARLVEVSIKTLDANNVLELATGRGATSAYLAGRYPDVRFEGIELSPAQLGLAKKKAKKIRNYNPVQGDYHDLSRYADGEFDILFVIEALCYSTDKASVFSEAQRVLKKGGVFIILDGYTETPRVRMSKDELLACELTEKSMALNIFEDYTSVILAAKHKGLSVVNDEDVSKFILPTLLRFERHALKYFKHPHLAKFVNHFISKKFIYNAIAGLLMPEVVGSGLLSYHITTLKKR